MLGLDLYRQRSVFLCFHFFKCLTAPGTIISKDSTSIGCGLNLLNSSYESIMDMEDEAIRIIPCKGLRSLTEVQY